MIKNFRILLFTIILIHLPLNSFSQTKSSRHDWQRIDSIFKKFQGPASIGSRSFKYDTGQEPDVNSLSPTQSIITKIKKTQVIKLIKYYTDYCNTIALIDPQSTLKSKIYSIDLFYVIKEKKIAYIMALIISDNDYILFEIGSSESSFESN